MSEAPIVMSQTRTLPPAPAPLLQVRDLEVDYRRPGGLTRAVRGVSFDIGRGRTVALVGESGSGKTTIGRAVLGLHTGSAQVRGSIGFDGTELVGLRSRDYRRLRGRRIAMIPQDPLAGLNPVHTIGRQVAEAALAHGHTGRRGARVMAIEALHRAGLDDAEERYDAYPHQLSGGQRQRVLIAIALVGEPDLIVADEPTSALDVTVQRRILDHIEELVRDSGASLLLITHDLGVATDRSDEVVVLRNGELIEQVPSASFMDDATDAYSRALAAAAPRMDSTPLVHQPAPATARNAPARSATGTTDAAPAWSATRTAAAPARSAPTAPSATATDVLPSAPPTPLIEARALTKTFPTPAGEDLVAVDRLNLTLRAGQSLGVVGESGSGKTTLARMVLGLTDPDDGRLLIAGKDREELRRRAARRDLRRLVQPVFQDPYSSLDPAHSVATSIAEPLRALTAMPGRERRARVADLLDQVRLPSDVAGRKPYELSGGQMQRVAIARALAISPGLLVLDEPVSSLDVSVQDQILRLLADLRSETDLAYLFISHDLAVVRQICTDVVVMRHGRVVERGRTMEVFASPQHDYTRELITAIPGGRHVTETQAARVTQVPAVSA